MSDNSDYQLSEDDLDDSKHVEIVGNILNLNKIQRVKKSSRTEPTLHVSEFNLVKSVASSSKNSVKVNDLVKVLKTGKKHIKIKEKVESAKIDKRTLSKPLEKPQAERVGRLVGYEKSRYLFDRWEAFVTSNRAQAHHVFPQNDVESLKVKTNDVEQFTNSWTFKSDLQKELDKLEDKVEKYHVEDADKTNEFPLSLRELRGKRKEEAKLRAHQSFKEAKARRQNKIKSKKYHRILRKEKIRQKLKEFEELQKTNPEEALKKLEEIEKARVLERYSLRHKGTGQWAKSKQVRAKYDKESRQVLAQQLQISKDLTQKQKHLGSDSEDEALEAEHRPHPSISSSENPWFGGQKSDSDVVKFMNDYKKFCSEEDEKEDHSEVPDEMLVKNKDDVDENVVLKKKDLKNKQIGNGKKAIKVNDAVKTPRTKNPKTSNSSIEELFNKTEIKLKEKLNKKLLKRKGEGKSRTDTKKLKCKKNTIQKNKKIDLALPSQSKKQIIDEEMLETPFHQEDYTQNSDINVLKNILKDESSVSQKTSSKLLTPSADIDPNKFMKPQVTNLGSLLPDLVVEDENVQDSQKNIIIEAFEDYDIVDEFSKEKQQDIDKDKPQTIDLNLPGWGSWSGTGINPKKQRKRRRFIVKMPEVLPRKDANRGALIINEKVAKIRPHLVSDVPFPFKTVKDYEASIRAPIGNTFVPELAYRKFIRPTVETRMGTIIEPATVSALMGIPRKK